MRLSVEGGKKTVTSIKKPAVMPKPLLPHVKKVSNYVAPMKKIVKAAAAAKPKIISKPKPISGNDWFQTQTNNKSAVAAVNEKIATKKISGDDWFETKTNNKAAVDNLNKILANARKAADSVYVAPGSYGGYGGGGGGSGGSSGGGSGGSSGGSSGGGSGGSSGGSTSRQPVYDQSKDPAYLTSQAKLNDLWKQSSGYKDQIDAMMKTGFTYDPTKDASYTSLQALATKNAKSASGEAMESMNDRGILNSTIMGDRLGQIEQTAQDAVTAQVPVLKNAAYGQYMDKMSTLNSMWTTTNQQAQTERAFGEDTRRWNVDYNLEVDKFNTSNTHWDQEFNTANSHWNQEFNYNASQDAVNNSFKSDQIGLSYMEYDMQKAGQLQDAQGYKNATNTNNVLGELLQYKSATDALSQISKNGTTYANSGVSFTDLLVGLEKRWPGFGAAAKKKNVSFN